MQRFLDGKGEGTFKDGDGDGNGDASSTYLPPLKVVFKEGGTVVILGIFVHD